MGKIIETKIDNFSGGISNDLRVKDGSKFALTKHFDAFTYPNKLVPHRSTEADETKDYKIENFVYARLTSGGNTVYRLYGLGKVSGQAYAQIYVYDIDTAFTGGWGALADAKSKSAVGNRSNKIFFYYKDYIYVSSNSVIQRFHTTGVDDYNDNYKAVDLGNCQPVHHQSDDCAYFFTANAVHRLNDTTFDGGGTTAVLQLPTNLVINSACQYGDYLAIGCTSLGDSDKYSVIFLWDRDSSLTTLSERIDLGRGALMHLANLNGRLMAVINYFLDSTNVSAGKAKLLIRQISGQYAITVNELNSDTAVSTPSTSKFIKDNKLYFPLKATLNGDTRYGIWALDSLGRLSLDFIEEEVGTGNYVNIYSTGNIWWIAHSNDGSVNRTDNSESYTNTSIYESLIFNGGDSRLTKKLIGVEVMFEPLPANGQVVLKYRKDADLDGSWTTIFTYTTDDELSHGAINIEADGSNFPQYKEIQFRIESTGGAVITGLECKEEIIDKQLF